MKTLAAFAINNAADLLGNWLFVSAFAASPAAGYVLRSVGTQPVYVMVIVLVLHRIEPIPLKDRLTRGNVVCALL